MKKVPLKIHFLRPWSLLTFKEWLQILNHNLWLLPLEEVEGGKYKVIAEFWCIKTNRLVSTYTLDDTKGPDERDTKFIPEYAGWWTGTSFLVKNWLKRSTRVRYFAIKQEAVA